MIDEGNSNIEDMCNSRLKLEIKYIGSSNVSFTYLKDGIYKGYELKGYTFNIGTGEIIPFLIINRKLKFAFAVIYFNFYNLCYSIIQS